MYNSGYNQNLQQTDEFQYSGSDWFVVSFIVIDFGESF